MYFMAIIIKELKLTSYVNTRHMECSVYQLIYFISRIVYLILKETIYFSWREHVEEALSRAERQTKFFVVALWPQFVSQSSYNNSSMKYLVLINSQHSKHTNFQTARGHCNLFQCKMLYFKFISFQINLIFFIIHIHEEFCAALCLIDIWVSMKWVDS